ncbi:TetR/AcrR family transcriptional regulator [Ktedonobacter robiniae]|uniref:TetR family transcriptional regulator n=1 Tax=Ktedonobacter robiniae TaxID=2778365 RepID=A0ABQ3UXF8_9CHLR|nr:TetR/AcrR family transcriptional regulator [Ktedonobacter robiniae]GHO57072.1 TetR family transcriptional regulator [Ktedonobacter robiniae]
MTTQDRRVKRTQQLLVKALIALTLEREYDKITIRDITERAEVGYATFFRHYPDKDALLRDVLDAVLNELMTRLPDLSAHSDAAIVGTLLFHYVEEHEEVIRVLLRQSSSSLVQEAIAQSVQNILRQRTARPESPVPLEIAAYHIVTSSISLIQWWLQQGRPYSPERMGIIYRELIIQPTSNVAFALDNIEG